MPTEQTQLKLPAQVTNDLAALEKNSKRLSAKARTVFGITVIAGVVAAVCSAFGLWYAPSATLSAVQVPSELLSLITGEAPMQSASPNLSTAVEALLSSSAFRVMNYVVAIALIAIGVATQRIAHAAAGIGLLILTSVLPTSFESNLPNTGKSEQTQFTALAKSANYDGMSEMLSEKTVPEHLKQYVLAQALLVQAKNDDKPLDDAAKQGLVTGVKGVGVAVDSGQFASANPQVLYAMETKVLGQATSASAQAYFAKASTVHDWWNQAGLLLSGASLASLLAGLGLLGIAHRIRARLARIGRLLNTSNGASEVQALASGTSEKAHIFRGRVDLNA